MVELIAVACAVFAVCLLGRSATAQAAENPRSASSALPVAAANHAIQEATRSHQETKVGEQSNEEDSTPRSSTQGGGQASTGPPVGGRGQAPAQQINPQPAQILPERREQTTVVVQEPAVQTADHSADRGVAEANPETGEGAQKPMESPPPDKAPVSDPPDRAPVHDTSGESPPPDRTPVDSPPVDSAPPADGASPDTVPAPVFHSQALWAQARPEPMQRADRGTVVGMAEQFVSTLAATMAAAVEAIDPVTSGPAGDTGGAGGPPTGPDTPSPGGWPPAGFCDGLALSSQSARPAGGAVLFTVEKPRLALPRLPGQPPFTVLRLAPVSLIERPG